MEHLQLFCYSKYGFYMINNVLNYKLDILAISYNILYLWFCWLNNLKHFSQTYLLFNFNLLLFTFKSHNKYNFQQLSNLYLKFIHFNHLLIISSAINHYCLNDSVIFPLFSPFNMFIKKLFFIVLLRAFCMSMSQLSKITQYFGT